MEGPRWEMERIPTRAWYYTGRIVCDCCGEEKPRHNTYCYYHKTAKKPARRKEEGNG